MAIQKSKSWNEGSDKEGIKLKPEDSTLNESLIEDNIEDIVYEDCEYKKPVFNKNFYLDNSMYEGYKTSDNALKYLSSTSKKEDKIFIKVALVFMLTLCLVTGLEILVNSLLHKDLNSWGAIRYLLSTLITFLVVKFINKKGE